MFYNLSFLCKVYTYVHFSFSCCETFFIPLKIFKKTGHVNVFSTFLCRLNTVSGGLVSLSFGDRSD